uniref:Adipocyte plasma membrane-associated protein n=1 Tax=Scolopendra viridis TaxID=118503 RepID=A0A4D5R9U6_SCOVI
MPIDLRWKAILTGVTVLLLSIVLAFIPSPLDDPQHHIFNAPPKLEGPLAVNYKLQRARRLFENESFAPESFAADGKGNIYTGLGDGRIVRITADGQQQFITRTGQHHSKCGGESMEHMCGRPNSLRIDADGHLIVADAYKGLLKVLLPEGIVQVLIPSKLGVGGVPFKFLNGLEITKTGLIYFTESSTKWMRREHRYDILELNRLGRLMVYDPKKKTSRVLLTDLHFANGLALSHEEHFLLISETSICRILKYYLTTSKEGQTEVFADNLPGYPDNIRMNSNGNYYVGMSYARFDSSPFYLYLDYLGPFPNLRSFIAKLLPLSWYDIFLPKHAIVVELNRKGEIVGSLHDSTAKVIETVSEAFEHNKRIYIGSFESKFIGMIDLTF